MSNELQEHNNHVPGIGNGGMVMCPLMRGMCAKGGCEWWTIMNVDGKDTGRCAMFWLSSVSTQIRSAIDKLSTNQTEINIDET